VGFEKAIGCPKGKKRRAEFGLGEENVRVSEEARSRQELWGWAEA